MSYNTLMNVAQRLLVWLCSGLLKLSLFSVALSLAVLAVFGTPTNIKNALKNSNVYGTAVDEVLNQAKKGAENSTGTELSIDNPVVQQAAKSAFSPAFLETSSEQIIGGTYNWLDGKSAQPDFQVDIGPAKQAFIDSVVDAAGKRVSGLPVCTKAQLLALQGTTIDAFTIPCRPAGLDIAAEQQKIRTQMTNNKDFLPQTVLSAQSLPKDSEGQNSFDKLNQAPKAYRLSKSTPWVFTMLALLSGLGLVFVQARRKGIRSVGVSLITVGATLGLIAFLLGWLLRRSLSSTGSIGKTLQASEFQKSFLAATDSLLGQYVGKLLLFTIGYIVSGIAILVALRFIWKSTKPMTEAQPTTQNNAQ